MVSGGAVEKHVSNIFAKIDLPDAGADNRRVLAVLAWLRPADLPGCGLSRPPAQRLATA